MGHAAVEKAAQIVQQIALHGEEEEGGDSSAGTGKKGRKKLSFLACDNCSFRDVCYVRRDYFRRFGPDFQKKDFHQGLGKIEVRGGDEDA